MPHSWTIIPTSSSGNILPQVLLRALLAVLQAVQMEKQCTVPAVLSVYMVAFIFLKPSAMVSKG